MDCYTAADFLGASVEAAAEMLRTQWKFVGYSSNGEYLYAPKPKIQQPEICPNCFGAGGAIGSGLESDGPCHSGPYK